MFAHISYDELRVIQEHDKPPINRELDEREDGAQHMSPIPKIGRPLPSSLANEHVFFTEIFQDGGTVLPPCQSLDDPFWHSRRA
jgi:hypothetical protein